ncbi:MAG: alanine racemase [Methylococcaceae bacterium]|nr:alanine racemase [Methylococcaceae bacterium]
MIPAAHAVLDLSAPRHNLAEIRRHAPDSRIMAVIKANGYGHGLLRIAKALRGADAFAVARVEEGIRLREAGIRERIAVLEGFTSGEELELVRRHRLEPVVHSLYQVEMIEAATGIAALGVWLKLDTGMNRLGFTVEQFLPALRRLEECPIVRTPISLMSHLAKADELDSTETERQLSVFHRVTEGLEGERSIANSAGILGWPGSRSDWVRPGILLLGVSPFQHRKGLDHNLRPVMTLQSRLIAIKNIAAGDAVGYGGRWVAPAATRLGVVAIGYGDGYPRAAGSGTPVLIGTARAPIVGRVSMDMLTVDLSRCPAAAIGDPVILWGEGLPVEEVAECAGTIPYTLLCAVTQRVRIIEEHSDTREVSGSGTPESPRKIAK